MRRLDRKGQAMTEVVLLFPIFLMFLFAFAKIFALLILVQKIEIASFYAARRWQLESHRNVAHEGFDNGQLKSDIQQKVLDYLGYNNAQVSGFLDLSNSCRATPTCSAGAPGVTVQRTQVWQVVTVTACTAPYQIPFMTYSENNNPSGFVLCSTKYVPNRDRPIAFILPGLQN